MPPETPTTARWKPARWISLWRKRQRISVAKLRIDAQIVGKRVKIHSGGADAVEFFDGQQQAFVAGQGRDDPLAAEVPLVEGGHGQGFVEHRRLGHGLAVRPTARLPPQKHSPSSNPTRFTRITTAPSNCANDLHKCS